MPRFARPKSDKSVVIRDKCDCHPGRHSLSERQWAQAAVRHRLTPRELEALQWLFDTDHRAYIGAAMGISVKGVDAHLSRAFKKTGVENRGDLILTLMNST